MTARAWPWWVCGLLLLATLLNYMDRQTLAVSLPTLKSTFQLGEARIGWLEGSFGFAFAFGSVFFGALADRIGPRVLYPLVLAGWSLAGMATALAAVPQVTSVFESPDDPPGTGVFRWLLLCRIVLGIFEAGHWPCALLTVRAILTANDRTLGNGLLQSGASLGAILIPQYVRLSESLDYPWTFPFWSIGIVGLLWVPAWVALMSRSPSLARPAQADAPADGTTHDNPTARVAPWRMLVVLGVIVGTLTVSWQFLRAWLPLYLQDNRGYSRSATLNLTTAYFIAADVGCLLSGALIKWLTLRGWDVHRGRMLAFALFVLLTAAAAVIPWVSGGERVLLLIAGAGILGLHPIYYALAQELPTRGMGVLSGALAASGWIISSLFQIRLGKLIQDEKSYDVGLTLVGLAPVLGLVALLLLWNRRSDFAKTLPQN